MVHLLGQLEILSRWIHAVSLIAFYLFLTVADDVFEDAGQRSGVDALHVDKLA